MIKKIITYQLVIISIMSLFSGCSTKNNSDISEGGTSATLNSDSNQTEISNKNDEEIRKDKPLSTDSEIDIYDYERLFDKAQEDSDFNSYDARGSEYRKKWISDDGNFVFSVDNKFGPYGSGTYKGTCFYNDKEYEVYLEDEEGYIRIYALPDNVILGNNCYFINGFAKYDLSTKTIEIECDSDGEKGDLDLPVFKKGDKLHFNIQKE